MRGVVGFIGLVGFLMFCIWGIFSVVKRNYKIAFQIIGMVISIIFLFTSVYIMKPASNRVEKPTTEVEALNDSSKEIIVSTANNGQNSGNEKNTPEDGDKPVSEGEGKIVYNSQGEIFDRPVEHHDEEFERSEYGESNLRAIDGRLARISGDYQLFVDSTHIFAFDNGRYYSGNIVQFEEAEWSQEGDVVSISVVETKYGPELHALALKPGKGKIIAKYKGFEFYKSFTVTRSEVELKQELFGPDKDKARIVISPKKDKYYADDIITVTLECEDGYDFNYFQWGQWGGLKEYAYPIVGKVSELKSIWIYPGPSKAIFGDKNLEQAVRDKIGKSSGTLMLQDIREITSLDCSGRGIETFQGIEYMYKLRELNAEGSNIYGSLKSLDKSLSLISVNLSNSGIEDISGIHILKNLKYLDLRNNKIQSINMLQYLNNLETLYLKGNQIYDYSPVKGYYDKLVNKDFEL